MTVMCAAVRGYRRTCYFAHIRDSIKRGAHAHSVEAPYRHRRCRLPAKPSLVFAASEFRYVSTPTIAPSKHVVSVPDTIDFKPSDTTSSRFSGHMVESPAIMMPSEPKLAKPHMA